MKNLLLTLLLLPALAGTHFANAAPLGTGFNYQGRLNDGGASATGNYDMIFNLYDDPTNGNVLGSFCIFEVLPAEEAVDVSRLLVICRE